MENTAAPTHMTYEEALAITGKAVRLTKQQKVEAAWARMLGPEGYARRVARSAR